MNIYAFLLKINGKVSKIQKLAQKIIQFTQQDRKGVKSVQKGKKMAQLASQVSPAGALFGHLEHSFTHFYAFLSGFREHLNMFAEI